VVAETWFTSLHNDNQVNIDEYILFRKDRLHTTAGGVAVYVRDDIDASVVVLQSENLSAVTEDMGGMQMQWRYVLRSRMLSSSKGAIQRRCSES
jgi:hypothetical protein